MHDDEGIVLDDQSSTTTWDGIPLVEHYCDSNYGRTFHRINAGDGLHPFPVDEEEGELEYLRHGVIQQITEDIGLFTPLAKSLDFLEVACGAGHLATHIADEYPHIKVIGLDIDGSRFEDFVPPNLSFEVCDITTQTWCSREQDVIVLRCPTGAIRNLPQVLKDAFDSLKPGGRVEIQDFRSITSNDKNFQQSGLYLWQLDIQKALKDQGYSDISSPEDLVKCLEKGGFIDIMAHQIPIPVNNSEKTSNYILQNYINLFSDRLGPITHVNCAGIEPKIRHQRINSARAYLLEKEYQLNFFSIVAQKPQKPQNTTERQVFASVHTPERSSDNQMNRSEHIPERTLKRRATSLLPESLQRNCQCERVPTFSRLMNNKTRDVTADPDVKEQVSMSYWEVVLESSAGGSPDPARFSCSRNS